MKICTNTNQLGSLYKVIPEVVVETSPKIWKTLYTPIFEQLNMLNRFNAIAYLLLNYIRTVRYTYIASEDEMYKVRRC